MLKFKNKDLGAKNFGITEKNISCALHYKSSVLTQIQCSPCPSGIVQVFFNFEHNISKFCDLDDDDPKGSKSSLSVSRCVASPLQKTELSRN